MSPSCCAPGSTVMLLACSGGSNVGQLTNRVAVELTQEGIGRMFCLAGVAAGLGGFVQSVRDTDVVIVLDGCEIGCAAAAFERQDLPLSRHLVLTGLGIEKNHDLTAIRRQDVDRIKMMVRQATGWTPPRLARADSGGGGCCG